jgi:transcriptional regulator GlxA family with amidase domain
MKRRDAQLIEEIRQYLDDNLYQQHTIQDLCRQFTINREKLQVGFHELVHSTVHAYIIRQRLERAAQRLVESDDSIKAIAIESGYKKQRSFNKTFKTIYRLTPATFRKVHQASILSVHDEQSDRRR